MLKVRKYFFHYSNWPKKNLHFYQVAYLSEFEKYLKSLNQGSIIADIGCGTGELLKVLKLYSDKMKKKFILYGVEKDRSMFKAIDKVKGINYYNEDLFIFLNKKNNFFDLIFLIDVLEHINVSKITQALKLIKKSLKKDGFLLIKIPNAESVLTSGYMRFIDPTHTFSFTKESLSTILKNEGFKIVELRGQKFPNFWFSFLFKIPRFFIESFLKIILFFYYGDKALSSIQTPNLIVVCQKQ